MDFLRLKTAFTTPHTRWTPTQAYRWVVVPLAAMHVIVGFAFVVQFGVLDARPNAPIPFVSSAVGNRWAFYGIGVFALALGVGLIRRLRIAWYGFFVYLAAATVVQFVGFVFDPKPYDPPSTFVPLIVVFNAAFGFVVYLSTRRVFQRPPVILQSDAQQP